MTTVNTPDTPNSTSGKRRRPNFTSSETLALVEAVKKRNDVIHAKVDNKVMIDAKHAAWEEVTQAVNRVSRTRRYTGEVRRKWKDLRCCVKRKAFQDVKQARHKGAGSVFEVTYTESEGAVLELLSTTSNLYAGLPIQETEAPLTDFKMVVDVDPVEDLSPVSSDQVNEASNSRSASPVGAESTHTDSDASRSQILMPPRVPYTSTSREAIKSLLLRGAASTSTANKAYTRYSDCKVRCHLGSIAFTSTLPFTIQNLIPMEALETLAIPTSSTSRSQDLLATEAIGTQKEEVCKSPSLLPSRTGSIQTYSEAGSSHLLLLPAESEANERQALLPSRSTSPLRERERKPTFNVRETSPLLGHYKRNGTYPRKQTTDSETHILVDEMKHIQEEVREAVQDLVSMQREQLAIHREQLDVMRDGVEAIREAAASLMFLARGIESRLPK
ncbi:uncharacterized protein LOC143024685 isoform X1 [Oratosquilla oratoria]|uniref:uncharacterized protein LOC143024685 isoform X1 n=1 Tax=Oratosquilla oratoria TaxID=337810 RepID=UPI003F772785